MPPNWLQRRISALLSSCLPSNCHLCGRQNPDVVCVECCQQFFSAHHKQRCVCCAVPLPGAPAGRCGLCLQLPPAFDSTISACDYIAPLDQLVLSLKFDHRLAIAPVMARFIAQVALTGKPDLLIPVPLSRRRLRERGFNQALEIAKPLARQLALPLYSKLLWRVRDTTPQTLLPPSQRQQNIRNAFSLNPAYADKIAGRHIGVVDDVITTGATLREVARCLKSHGAASVSNLVFARTPPH